MSTGSDVVASGGTDCGQSSVPQAGQPLAPAGTACLQLWQWKAASKPPSGPTMRPSTETPVEQVTLRIPRPARTRQNRCWAEADADDRCSVEPIAPPAQTPARPQ